MCPETLSVEQPQHHFSEPMQLTSEFFFARIRGNWAHSSVVERCPDKTEVEGPIPSEPTKVMEAIPLKNKEKRFISQTCLPAGRGRRPNSF